MNRLEKEIKKSISEWSDMSHSRSFMRKAFSRTQKLVSARSNKKIAALERNLGILKGSSKDKSSLEGVTY